MEGSRGPPAQIAAYIYDLGGLRSRGPRGGSKMAKNTKKHEKTRFFDFFNFFKNIVVNF